MLGRSPTLSVARCAQAVRESFPRASCAPCGGDWRAWPVNYVYSMTFVVSARETGRQGHDRLIATASRPSSVDGSSHTTTPFFASHHATTRHQYTARAWIFEDQARSCMRFLMLPSASPHAAPIWRLHFVLSKAYWPPSSSGMAAIGTNFSTASTLAEWILRVGSGREDVGETWVRVRARQLGRNRNECCGGKTLGRGAGKVVGGRFGAKCRTCESAT